ncbi:hypothetical protein NY08_4397 [Rhodococcus sp. B7740]|nr:hypothetical protein NY08_4397 [Rhodococcus sp. B7740]
MVVPTIVQSTVSSGPVALRRHHRHIRNGSGPVGPERRQ